MPMIRKGITFLLCLSLLWTSCEGSSDFFAWDTHPRAQTIHFNSQALAAVEVGALFNAMNNTQRLRTAFNERCAHALYIHTQAMTLMRQTIRFILGSNLILETVNQASLVRYIDDSNQIDNTDLNRTRQFILLRQELNELLDDMDSLMSEFPPDLMPITLIRMTREWLQQPEPNINDDSEVMNSFILEMMAVAQGWRSYVVRHRRFETTPWISNDTIYLFQITAQRILDLLDLYANPNSGRYPGDRSTIPISYCRNVLQFRGYWTNILLPQIGPPVNKKFNIHVYQKRIRKILKLNNHFESTQYLFHNKNLLENQKIMVSIQNETITVVIDISQESPTLTHPDNYHAGFNLLKELRRLHNLQQIHEGTREAEVWNAYCALENKPGLLAAYANAKPVIVDGYRLSNAERAWIETYYAPHREKEHFRTLWKAIGFALRHGLNRYIVRRILGAIHISVGAQHVWGTVITNAFLDGFSQTIEVETLSKTREWALRFVQALRNSRSHETKSKALAQSDQRNFELHQQHNIRYRGGAVLTKHLLLQA